MIKSDREERKDEVKKARSQYTLIYSTISSSLYEKLVFSRVE